MKKKKKKNTPRILTALFHHSKLVYDQNVWKKIPKRINFMAARQPVEAATSSRTPASSTSPVVEARGAGPPVTPRSWAALVGRSGAVLSALRTLAVAVIGTGPLVTPRSRAEVETLGKLRVAMSGTGPPVTPRSRELAPRSGEALSALGTLEVAAKGTVPQVRPRSTEVGVMETGVEETGLVEEATAAVVKVAEEMGLVAVVKAEEVAATAARTSCT